MQDLSVFLKPKQKKAANVKFAPTKLFTDENGKPIEWEFKHLEPKVEAEIRELCTIKKLKAGKKKSELTFDENKYTLLIVCESCVWPDLGNAELQDSYGVKTPEELIQKLIPVAGDYLKLCKFIINYQGLNLSLEDEVEEAKN